MPAERAEASLPSLLLMAREEYVERFRGSPMKRAKLEGLQRNAAVAMGNRRDPAYVEALGEALERGSDGVRVHAAWALGEIGGPDAVERLRRALANGPEDVFGAEIEAALKRAGRAGRGARSGRPAGAGQAI